MKLFMLGKLKTLKKGVSSYFTKDYFENNKVKVLVGKVHRIEYIVVQTETDALLLENNLIKKYHPRYNVMLKDDKTYPWICIKKERFPRIFLTRNVIKDGSEYYGPYTSVRTAKALLDLIKELYQLRSCNYDLSESNIKTQKYKVCLDFHIGNCKGACEGLQAEEDYNKDITAIRNIVKGNFKEAIVSFEELMMYYAGEMEFEEAQKIKETIDLLANYQAKSTVVNPSITNVDVFSIVSDESYSYVNFFKISNWCNYSFSYFRNKEKIK